MDQKVTIPFRNGTNFHSHKNHNPACDILEGHIDDDSFITYGIYVNGPRKGQEFCEYYRGKNYNVRSKLKSYSRCWNPTNIPVKYYTMWQLLRSLYDEMPK